MIKQDIYSQMLAFNLLQSFIADAQKEFDSKGLTYKHEMKINKNMAVGFFKKSLIVILVPVRKNRNYPRNKTKDKNKYSITKRKSF